MGPAPRRAFRGQAVATCSCVLKLLLMWLHKSLYASPVAFLPFPNDVSAMTLSSCWAMMSSTCFLLVSCRSEPGGSVRCYWEWALHPG